MIKNVCSSCGQPFVSSDAPVGAPIKCPRCGAELPPGLAQDLCPKCLLQVALGTQPGVSHTQTTADSPAPSHSRAMPKPGEQLGHYRIMHLLGEGGMGAVFDADDIDTGRRTIGSEA